jgi:hypothetical protein
MIEDGIHEISRMVKCDCYSHAIEVCYIRDEIPECYINIWYDGNRNNTPLTERAGNAFKMLTSGYVIDGLVLNHEKVIQLIKALTDTEKMMAEDERKAEEKRREPEKS